MNASNPEETLIVGIGNSGRRDDGLGWAFLDRINELGYRGSTVYRYQLQIEDAEMISHFKHVIFIDATESKFKDGYSFEPLSPEKDFIYSTHQLSPSAVLFLSQDLYETTCECRLLAICGEEWELKQGLSQTAKDNLEKALADLKTMFTNLN